MRNRPNHLRLAILLAAFSVPSSAKVITDGSLGPAKSLPGPNFPITPDLGHRRGGNLFHSFDRFNLKPGESATFSGPPAVRNILARVTNREPSTIRGAIRSTIPNANLYLINPAGIVFREGASLDLSGAFVATTADSVALGSTGHFPASPATDAVLVSAPPSEFGFTSSPSPIDVRDATLRVPGGRTLGILAGEITVNASTLAAPAGRIALLAAAPNSTIRFDASDLDAPPTFIGGAPGGAIALSGNALLTVDDDGSAGAGRIDLAANVITVTESAAVSSQTLGPADGRGIRIHSPESFTLNDGFVASTTTGEGAAGNIDIDAGRLLIAGSEFGGARGIAIQNGATGRAGSIRIDADSLRIRRSGFIVTQSDGLQPAGNIDLRLANELVLTDGGTVGTTATASGDGGVVTIRAPRLLLDGRGTRPTGIFSDTALNARGDGGAIDIDTGSLRIHDLAVLSTSTNGAGRGGALSVRADDVLLDGFSQRVFTGIAANTQSTGRDAGPGGTVNLSVGSLTIRDGAGVAARSRGPGRPGDVRIDARRDVLIDGRYRLAGITTETADRVPADGGNVTLRAGGDISVISGQISAKTSRDRGNIQLRSARVLLTEASRVTAEAGGDGGQIDIATEFTVLRDDSEINGQARGIDVLVAIESSALLLDFDSAILTDRPAFAIDDTVAQGIARLPAGLADSSLRFAEVCPLVAGDISSFVIRGRGGLPASPGGSAPGVRVTKE